uniref:Thromboxane-A synthase n=1 Tax=Oncorhynchus tshawytscha TaxID=74940 RepID=A0A8C8MIV7_ONCTS
MLCVCEVPLRQHICQIRCCNLRSITTISPIPFYLYATFPYSSLAQCGIRHPKPSPFFGNLFLFRQGFFGVHTDLIHKYGRVCGYYLGRRPVVVVADPDMLRQIMVKDFSTFPNRMPMSDCLLMLRNEHWKRVRSILTPSFSAAKMKEARQEPLTSSSFHSSPLHSSTLHPSTLFLSSPQKFTYTQLVFGSMGPLINTATDTLLTNLNCHAESGESFDIHRCFGCFTMDVIASVAFGTQVDSQKDPDDPFVHHAQKFFSFSFFTPIMFVFIAFPFLIPLARFLPNKRRDEMNNFFINCIQKIIRQRDEQPVEERRRDFLQLMLETRSSKECVSLEHFDVVNHADELAPTHTHTNQQENVDVSHESPNRRSVQTQKRMMSDDEIVGQAFVFFLAGYETSSNTLAFTCYLLALHPECQSKLQAEVDDFFTRYDSPDYTNVQELKYLDMVISEALRLYPPGFRFAREVDEDCMVNGQFLPKGATLEIPAGYLHYDPEYWPEPEKFIPERFTVEAKASRHPFVYLPFGAGPRSCVGMRLAQLEIKMALVHVFRKFNIVACTDTKVPLELKSHTTLGPKNGIYVTITKREIEGEPATPPAGE